MFLTLLTSSVALATSAPIHQAPVVHANGAVDAVYATQSSIRLKDIDARPVTRQANALCRWQASMVLTRAVAGQDGRAMPAMGKAVHSFAPIGGTEVGKCKDVRGRIDKQVARHGSATQAQAVMIARQDHGALAAEMDGFHALMSKGG